MAVCIIHKHSVRERCQVQLINVNFGNDSSFLMTGGASREEKLVILNENPVDETKELCPKGGSMDL